MNIFKKTIEGKFNNHTISVVNTWFNGLKLFHNEELIEHNRTLFSISKKKPLISKNLIIEGTERRVDVYVRAILTVQIMIKVDDKKIAGASLE